MTGGKEAYQDKIGDPKIFLSYLEFCKQLTNENKYESAHNEICSKLKYKMTKLRTAELIMYINGGKVKGI